LARILDLDCRVYRQRLEVLMAQQTLELHDCDKRKPPMMLGLICSSCGLAFTSEKALRDHQVACRSSLEFLSQFDAQTPGRNPLN
jgi:hypothetical protein